MGLVALTCVGVLVTALIWTFRDVAEPIEVPKLPSSNKPALELSQPLREALTRGIVSTAKRDRQPLAVSTRDNNEQSNLVTPMRLSQSDRSLLLRVAWGQAGAVNDSRCRTLTTEDPHTVIIQTLGPPGAAEQLRSQGHSLCQTVYHAISARGISQKRRNSTTHIHILGPPEAFAKTLFRRGRHTVSLRSPKASYLLATDIARQNLTLREVRDQLCRQSKRTLRDCRDLQDQSLNLHHTYHFASTDIPIPGPIPASRWFARGITQYDFDQVSPFLLAHSLNSSIRWMLNHLSAEGDFTYLYDPRQNRPIPGRQNMIRQLMASRLLAELSQEHRALRPAHQRNLRHILTHWYKEQGEHGFIEYRNKSKLGAIAMALRTLCYSPLYKTYEVYASRLAHTILSMQKDSGAFNAWYREPSYPYSEKRLLYFYSGEAILSLIEMYKRSGKMLYLDAALKSQKHYLKVYVDRLAENYYPALVPWHAMTLNKLFLITGDRRYAQAIFRLTDQLLKIQNQSGTPFPEFLGRFFSPMHRNYGRPHSASDGVYLEGIAYAYEIALRVGDEPRKASYRTAMILAARNLLSLQYDAGDRPYLGDFSRADGGVRTSLIDPKIRIDTTQHHADALMKVLAVLDRGKQLN